MDPEGPPVWIVHGTTDETIAFEQSEIIATRGEEVGVEVVLHPQQGAGHGFREIDLFTDQTGGGVPLIEDQLDFLTRVLEG